ncbi:MULTISPECIES: YifB family Mg chelatase-like AAA ATPase [unclassified Nocardioides]|uniref:YifB family Mg chelatase-like AAA ATPase n=1 Tax=unclassified Nocardioides TaxID=2615069 RepID=UPI001154ABB8|nr:MULTISPECIES: YifB family Mg chelatase-like AAA ATPase [unclassified Nocardioides]TQK72054.1 magnesium chelatase family protein [Nocardioides sp. SLBN-35]WGY03759.1 YifB family Mg chelatase-like AAA ATPase [Nocardioides sp. QY071]
MPFATARCVALAGAVGHLIDVQTDVSVGQPTTVVVGRADASLREGVDRVRMALINNDLHWPATKRCTFLFSPADLRKSGTHFDLAMAVSLLAADGQLEPPWLDSMAFVGELTLAGGLRPTLGVLPMTLAAAAAGIRRIFVPEPQVAEAMMVPDMEAIGVRSLSQVIATLRGEEPPDAPPVTASTGLQLITWRGEERLDELDLADLYGMDEEKYAVEVAAAGGHPIQLSGPKGCGKTSLAERIPTILPDLTPEESLELTALQSLAGVLDPGDGMVVRPPFAAPHHDASKVSVIGGGSGRVQPGEISRAHCGVLFMDEFPLFRSDVIEALRQPLENGDITIARRDESITLPAGGMLVLASNPCPCGNWSAVARSNRCTCAETVRRAYRARMSGPIVDRIDIVRHVLPPSPASRDPFRSVETSAEVRVRIAAARERQQERFAGRSWRLNAHIPSPRLKDVWPLADQAQRVIDAEMLAGRLSARGAVRVHRLAWTVADLRSVRTGRDVEPGVDEARTALRLRSARSLDLAMFRSDASEEGIA